MEQLAQTGHYCCFVLFALYCACIAQARAHSLSGVNRRLLNSNAIHATQQLPWLCAAFADDEQGTSRSCQHHNHDRNGSHGSTRIRKGRSAISSRLIRGSATGLSSVARIVGIAGLLLSRAGSDLRGRDRDFERRVHAR